MEEIVTVDGRQFKLTVDRPLTATEKAQVLTEIRKQTGCGTCHQPRTLSTGGVYSLPFGNDGAGTDSTVGKGSGSNVTLTASPAGGVRPYTVRFWYATDGATISLLGPAGGSTTLPGDAEGVPISYTYMISDADVVAASGNSAALRPTDVNTTNGTISTSGGASAPLLAGSIRFYSSVVDSCTGASKGTCAQYVDVAITCIPPTCGFVVT